MPQAPVVIVGAGPVGVRVASELARRAPQTPIVLYGAERREPYDRARLSLFLAGEMSWEALTGDLELPQDGLLEKRLGCAVVTVCRGARTVVDAKGFVQPYSQLVLATGSTPCVPDIPGIARPNVFTFRDVEDAERLFARRVRSRRTVVLGGGLLGLEAARAMRRFRTEVVVIEQEPRLMPQQLDDEAAALLRAHVERLGISVVTGDGVRRALGEARVEAVQLRSGRRVDCDTVIVATGIRPNVRLALRAGLAVARGIRVDDALRTTDPAIYAVGECAEHRGLVYGIAAPGLEQAAVAAANIAGGSARYQGTIATTRLRLFDLPVISIGAAHGGSSRGLSATTVYRHRAGSGYTRIITERGRLAGALAVGAVPDLNELQRGVLEKRRLLSWRVGAFLARRWPGCA